jgi:hypothetical protein
MHGQYRIKRVIAIEGAFNQVTRRGTKEQRIIFCEDHLFRGEMQQDDFGVLRGRRAGRIGAPLA